MKTHISNIGEWKKIGTHIQGFEKTDVSVK